jgi:hypothetical protein
MISAIAHELKFWKWFITTPRFLDGWVKKKKTPELNEVVYNFLKQNNGKTLDVGSGVVSLLNGTVNDLTACDPLGELYECIFDYQKHNITPCLPFTAEELKFENEFDVVHISNALDHSQDPKKAFENLLRATKKYLIIQGFENEADYENWQGFHQWNMTLGDSLTISNKEGIKLDTKDYQLKIVLKQTINLTNKNWIIFIAEK